MDFRHTGHIGVSDAQKQDLNVENLKSAMAEVAAVLRLDETELTVQPSTFTSTQRDSSSTTVETATHGPRLSWLPSPDRKDLPPMSMRPVRMKLPVRGNNGGAINGKATFAEVMKSD